MNRPGGFPRINRPAAKPIDAEELVPVAEVIVTTAASIDHEVEKIAEDDEHDEDGRRLLVEPLKPMARPEPTIYQPGPANPKPPEHGIRPRFLPRPEPRVEPVSRFLEHPVAPAPAPPRSPIDAAKYRHHFPKAPPKPVPIKADDIPY